MIITFALIGGIAWAGMYVMKLRSDNAILKANQVQLEQSIESQKKTLDKQKKDFQDILASNQQLNKLINTLKKDMESQKSFFLWLLFITISSLKDILNLR